MCANLSQCNSRSKPLQCMSTANRWRTFSEQENGISREQILKNLHHFRHVLLATSGKDNPMTPETNNTTAKMTAVKAAWDKAPAGPKKDNALKHYQAAEKAHKANNDAEARKELDAASKALS